MAGLLDAIGVQAQSLDTQSTAISVAGKNLSNIDNPNYADESVNIGSTQDGGANVVSITDARNQIIDAQLAQELSTQGSLSAQQQMTSSVQALLGEQVNTSQDSSNASATSSSTDANSGLYASLDNFFNAFSQLSSDPSQSSYQQTAISSAQSLAQQLNGLSSSLAQTSGSIGQEINSQVSQAQGLLQSIATLNGQIAKLEVNTSSSAAGSALDLINERQGDINTLSGLMNVSVSNSPEGLGQVDVTTTDTSGNPVSLVSDTSVQGTLAYNGTNFTGGSGAVDLNVSNGSLAGYQSVLTNTIAPVQTNLDNIAEQLVTSVNGIYAFGNNGAAGDFFTPAGTTAATIAVNPAVTAATLATGTSGQSGDNSVAVAIANLQTTQFTNADSIQGTFGDYYNNNVVTAVGQQLSSITTAQNTSSLVYNNLLSQQQSAEGVSTDQETSNLMVYQRAYQAIANVISVMNTLLDTVVTGLGIS